MVDIVLKVTKPEMEVTTANTVYDCVLYRVFAPSTAKVTITDSSNTEIGSLTMPGGFVEIMEKRKTDRVSANPSVLCTPISYK